MDQIYPFLNDFYLGHFVCFCKAFSKINQSINLQSINRSSCVFFKCFYRFDFFSNKPLLHLEFILVYHFHLTQLATGLNTNSGISDLSFPHWYEVPKMVVLEFSGKERIKLQAGGIIWRKEVYNTFWRVNLFPLLYFNSSEKPPLKIATTATTPDTTALAHHSPHYLPDMVETFPRHYDTQFSHQLHKVTVFSLEVRKLREWKTK